MTNFCFPFFPKRDQSRGRCPYIPGTRWWSERSGARERERERGIGTCRSLEGMRPINKCYIFVNWAWSRIFFHVSSLRCVHRHDGGIAQCQYVSNFERFPLCGTIFFFFFFILDQHLLTVLISYLYATIGLPRKDYIYRVRKKKKALVTACLAL